MPLIKDILETVTNLISFHFLNHYQHEKRESELWILFFNALKRKRPMLGSAQVVSKIDNQLEADLVIIQSTWRSKNENKKLDVNANSNELLLIHYYNLYIIVQNRKKYKVYAYF